MDSLYKRIFEWNRAGIENSKIFKPFALFTSTSHPLKVKIGSRGTNCKRQRKIAYFTYEFYRCRQRFVPPEHIFSPQGCVIIIRWKDVD